MGLKYGQQYIAGFMPAPMPDFQLYGGLQAFESQYRGMQKAATVQDEAEGRKIVIPGTFGNASQLATALRDINNDINNLAEEAINKVSTMGANALTFFESPEGQEFQNKLTYLEQQKKILEDNIALADAHGKQYQKQRSIALEEHNAGSKLFLRPTVDGFYLNLNDGFRTVEQMFDIINETPMFERVDGEIIFNPIQNPETAPMNAISDWFSEEFNEIAQFGIERGNEFVARILNTTENPEELKRGLIQNLNTTNIHNLNTFASNFNIDMPRDVKLAFMQKGYSDIIRNVSIFQSSVENNTPFPVENLLIPSEEIVGGSEVRKPVPFELEIYKKTNQYFQDLADLSKLINDNRAKMTPEEFRTFYENQVTPKEMSLEKDRAKIQSGMKILAEESMKYNVAEMAKRYADTQNVQRLSGVGDLNVGFGGAQDDMDAESTYHLALNQYSPGWKFGSSVKTVFEDRLSTYIGETHYVRRLSDLGITPKNPLSIVPTVNQYVYFGENMKGFSVRVLSDWGFELVSSEKDYAETMFIPVAQKDTNFAKHPNVNEAVKYAKIQGHYITEAIRLTIGDKLIWADNVHSIENLVKEIYPKYQEIAKSQNVTAKSLVNFTNAVIDNMAMFFKPDKIEGNKQYYGRVSREELYNRWPKRKPYILKRIAVPAGEFERRVSTAINDGIIRKIDNNYYIMERKDGKLEAVQQIQLGNFGTENNPDNRYYMDVYYPLEEFPVILAHVPIQRDQFKQSLEELTRQTLN